MDTTTIEIRSDQKDELDSLKLNDSEPYKSVLQRVIDGYSQDDGDDVQLGPGYEEIANEIANALDVAAFNGAMDDETARTLMNRLDELPEETARKTSERLQR